MFYPCWACCDHSTVFRIPNKNQIPLVWRSSKERLEVALHSVYFCMTPKDISCELFALCWRAKCATKHLSNRHSFPDSPWTWSVLLTDFSALRGHVRSNIDSPQSSNDRQPQHFAVSVRHKTLGRPCFFFAKQVKIPENALGFLGSQAESKSCLQQIYAPVFIMRQMLSPFSRMRPAFEDAANIQFSLYRVCLKHHKTQEALC